MRRFSGLWAVIQEARADNVTGEAAKVAYYFFLSLWPLLLGLFAFTGIFGGEPAFDWIMGWIRSVLPEDATRFVATYVRRITVEERPDMLSLGILLTLWSGSNIFAALADGLNVIYDVEEDRPWWKRRALSLGLLMAGTVLITAGSTAVLAGNEIAARVGIDQAVALLRYPVAFTALTAFLWLVYFFLPAREQSVAKRYIMFGGLVGASLWLMVTSAFKQYVANFGQYHSYGIVGAVIVLLLWLYLTALAILIGGEVAVSLEQGIHSRHANRKSKRRPKKRTEARATEA
jgi:membrane protein